MSRDNGQLDWRFNIGQAREVGKEYCHISVSLFPGCTKPDGPEILKYRNSICSMTGEIVVTRLTIHRWTVHIVKCLVKRIRDYVMVPPSSSLVLADHQSELIILTVDAVHQVEESVKFTLSNRVYRYLWNLGGIAPWI